MKRKLKLKKNYVDYKTYLYLTEKFPTISKNFVQRKYYSEFFFDDTEDVYIEISLEDLNELSSKYLSVEITNKEFLINNITPFE